MVMMVTIRVYGSAANPRAGSSRSTTLLRVPPRSYDTVSLHGLARRKCGVERCYARFPRDDVASRTARTFNRNHLERAEAETTGVSPTARPSERDATGISQVLRPPTRTSLHRAWVCVCFMPTPVCLRIALPPVGDCVLQVPHHGPSRTRLRWTI
ncbi:hypothetical protein MRX96_014902 [Rhipicephalus microplus]